MAYDNKEVPVNSGPSGKGPSNAELHYLMGAQLAQLGHYERAATEIIQALELQPDLHTARLQLGLLYLTLGQPERSLASWEPLGSLALDSWPRLFKQGLEALIHDDFERCVLLLEAGMSANTVNAPLNGDMERLAAKARAAAENRRAAAGAEAIRSDFSLYNQ